MNRGSHFGNGAYIRTGKNGKLLLDMSLFFASASNLKGLLLQEVDNLSPFKASPTTKTAAVDDISGKEVVEILSVDNLEHDEQQPPLEYVRRCDEELLCQEAEKRFHLSQPQLCNTAFGRVILPCSFAESLSKGSASIIQSVCGMSPEATLEDCLDVALGAVAKRNNLLPLAVIFSRFPEDYAQTCLDNGTLMLTELGLVRKLEQGASKEDLQLMSKYVYFVEQHAGSLLLRSKYESRQVESQLRLARLNKSNLSLDVWKQRASDSSKLRQRPAELFFLNQVPVGRPMTDPITCCGTKLEDQQNQPKVDELVRIIDRLCLDRKHMPQVEYLRLICYALLRAEGEHPKTELLLPATFSQGFSSHTKCTIL